MTRRRIEDALMTAREQKEKHIKVYNYLQEALFDIGCKCDNYYSRNCYGKELQDFLAAGRRLCAAVEKQIV